MPFTQTPPRIVAEIGCNHQGDLQTARRLIEEAARCRADVVKFQKRDVASLLTQEQYHAPHPEPYHAFGPSYGAHREALEFNLDRHRQLQDWCTELGTQYGCSVWDVVSARQIAALDPPYIKVPSACNTNNDLLKLLCDEFGGDIHVSLGMTTRAEEESMARLFESRGRGRALVLYACTSGYPVSFDDVCLLEITRLIQTFGERVKEIGFSGHHLGLAADIAAMVLGARWIERHFTLDRTLRGTDHAASLEPAGLQRLVRDAHNVTKALRAKPTELLPIEVLSRDKLKCAGWHAGWPAGWHGQAALSLGRGAATLSRSNQMADRPLQQIPRENTLRRIRAVVTDVDGVLTDGGMYYSERGDELKRFNTKDALGLNLLRAAGLKIGIMTRENSGLVTRRAAKIGVDRLGIGVQDKLPLLEQWAAEWGMSVREICYVGDDVNDLPALRAVGLACTPADAVSECRTAAHWVLSRRGGDGCVRELADALLQAHSTAHGQLVKTRSTDDQHTDATYATLAAT